MKIKKRTITAALCLTAISILVISGNVLAMTITFEGQANALYDSPITREGFDIGNPEGQEQHFHELIVDRNEYGYMPDNGTGVLVNDRDTQIFVKANPSSGFTTFNLFSVDVAPPIDQREAKGLTISGYLNNALTGTITIAEFEPEYTTLNGLSLGEVDMLVFDGIGNEGGFMLDNLDVRPAGTSPVPPEKCVVSPKSITIDSDKLPKAGEPVKFKVESLSNCNGPFYYYFSYCPYWGTDDYNANYWINMHNGSTTPSFQSENTVTHTFDRPGNYVVVAWTSPVPGALDIVSMVGCTVSVQPY